VLFLLLWLSRTGLQGTEPNLLEGTESNPEALSQTFGGAAFTGQWNTKGHPRMFEYRPCGKNYTIREVVPIFASHQVEWNILAKERPWWAVLTHEKYKLEDPPQEIKDEFYLSGSDSLVQVTNALKYAGRREPTSGYWFENVLDFGCGLGRISLHLANISQEVACVDQSVHMLMRAKKEVTPRLGTGRENAINFLLSTPDLLSAVNGARYDFVHSFITLQHMVTYLQVIYLEQLCDVLRSHGIGALHLSCAVGTPRPEACETERWIQQGGMQMHRLPLDDATAALNSRGCYLTQVLSTFSSDGKRHDARIYFIKNGTVKQ